LRKEKIVKEDASLSYFLSNKNAYVFGVTVPKEGSFLSSDEEIQPKFIENQRVHKKSFSCTLKYGRNKESALILLLSNRK
jgi:hypothetical protein